MFAVPFDARRLAVTGSEAPVIEGVSSLGSTDIGDYTFSGSGLLVYLAGQQAGKTLLALADRKGVVQPVSEAQAWGTGRLSPDGRRVANEIQTGAGGAGDIWIYELERKTLTRLTFEGANEYPIWTPDGRRVTFRSMLSGKHGIYWVPSDGSGRAELLLSTDTTATPTCWTPDGKFLVYSQPGPNKNNQLWILPAPGSDGAGKPHLLHDVPFSETGAQISPDGRWVAYVSSESGTPEVYLQPFPAPGGKMRISTQGGRAPRWSRDGRELFYWSGLGTAELMSRGNPNGSNLSRGSSAIALPSGRRHNLGRSPRRQTLSVRANSRHRGRRPPTRSRGQLVRRTPPSRTCEALSPTPPAAADSSSAACRTPAPDRPRECRLPSGL